MHRKNPSDVISFSATFAEKSGESACRAMGAVIASSASCGCGKRDALARVSLKIERPLWCADAANLRDHGYGSRIGDLPR